MSRWSPYPRERYGVYNGRDILGLGFHEAFEHEGLWNLFWISSSIVDDQLDWSGSVANLIAWSSVIPLAIGTAEQYVNSQLIKDIAAEVSAQDFVALMNKADCSGLILPRMMGGDEWFAVMDQKLELLSKLKPEIVIPKGLGDKVVPFNKNKS